MTNIIKFPLQKDILYTKINGEVVGIVTENHDLEKTTDKDIFSINGYEITRSELLAFIFITDLWQDVVNSKEE